MPESDGTLTPAEAAKQAVDEYGNPLSKYKQAQMRKELEDWNRSYRLIEPPPKPPTRLKREISVAPETAAGLDKVCVSIGDTRWGRAIDVLVKDWLKD